MSKVVFLGFLISILIVISIFQILPDKELITHAEPVKKLNFPTLIDPNFKIQVVQKGLDFPTKMTFVDNDTILIAQKANGQVAVIKNFELLKDPALDLNVESAWERGFTGLSSINYQRENFVFVYYTESATKEDTHVPGGGQNNGDKLVRYRWDGSMLVDPVLLLHPIPYSTNNHHGGAMTILDNYLYIIIGDNEEYNIRGKPGNFLINTSQERNYYDRGTIFKIDFEGNPAPNNPFPDPDLSKYYSYGVRNGYGITVDPLTKNIWDTENGPEVFDEINLIFSGFNSGWKKIMGPNGVGGYSSELSDLTSLEGSRYSDPEFTWKVPIGVTAIEFINSEKYGTEYQNDLLVGDSINGNLYHFELNDDRDALVFSNSLLEDLVADAPEEVGSNVLGKNFGIITDIKTGPDGYLYLVSMVQTDSSGWGVWRGSLHEGDLEKQGPKLGVIFRILPESVFIEIFEKLPPKRQVEQGILPNDVFCKEGLELIFKSKNNSPGCVKPTTAKKLIERGWANS